MKRPDIPVLTTLRFPAAFAILLFHYFAYTSCPSWIWVGFASGVSFFYVLSGFILYYNYADLPDRSFFWIARIARIWPVHLVTLAMTFCFLPFDELDGHASWRITLPANIFLVQAWLPFQGSVLSYNGVAWSLSVEAFFYLCFPWLLIVLKQRGSTFILSATFGLGLMITLFAALCWPAHAEFVASANPMSRLFEFVLGMTACKFWLDGNRSTANTGEWGGYEALTGTICLVMIVGLPSFIQVLNIASPIVNWLGLTVRATVFAGLIWVFAHQAGLFSRILSKRFLTFLGEISFSTYMCHQILLRWLHMIPVKELGDAWRLFSSYLLLTMSVSVALFYLVETPARYAIVSAFKRTRGL